MLNITLENFFEDSHEYRVQNNGEKKTRENFLKILTNIARKKMWGKNTHFFFKILTNIGSKKMAGRKRAINFL